MLPAGDGHGGMVQALLQSLATNSCWCFHDISWSVMKILDSSWFLNFLMWQLQGLRMKQQSSHVLLSLANLLQWLLGWTQLQASPGCNEESNWVHFKSHTRRLFCLAHCMWNDWQTARLVPASCMPWYVEAIQKELVSSCVHPSVAPQASLQDGRVDTHLRRKRRIQSGNGWTWRDDCCWIYVIPHHYHSLSWAKNTKCSHTQHLNRSRHRHERHGNNS